MTVIDNKIKARGAKNCFLKTHKTSAEAGKEKTTILLENSGSALEFGSKCGNSALYKNPKAALSTIPVVIDVYYTVEGLCLGIFSTFF